MGILTPWELQTLFVVVLIIGIAVSIEFFSKFKKKYKNWEGYKEAQSQENFEISNYFRNLHAEKLKLEPLRKFMSQFGATTDSQIIKLLSSPYLLNKLSPSISVAKVICTPNYWKTHLHYKNYSPIYCHKKWIEPYLQDPETLMVYFNGYLKEIKELSDESETVREYLKFLCKDMVWDPSTTDKKIPQKIIWKDLIENSFQPYLGMTITSFCYFLTGDEEYEIQIKNSEMTFLIWRDQKIYLFKGQVGVNLYLVEILLDT